MYLTNTDRMEIEAILLDVLGIDEYNSYSADTSADDLLNYFEDQINFWENKHQLQVDFWFASGASKVVIISDNLDMVIKIPISPYTGYGSCSYSYHSSSKWDYETGGFRELLFYPQSKEYGYDYCRLETELYNLAKEAKLDAAFAEEIHYRMIGNIPIYLQAKAESFDGVTEDAYYHRYNTLDNNTKEKYKTLEDKYYGSNCLPARTFNMALLDHFGIDFLKNLFEFLEVYSIDDLTLNNLGKTVIEGAPVLIDYCGYRG